MRHDGLHTTPWLRIEADLLGHRRVVRQPEPMPLPGPRTPDEIAAVQQLAAELDADLRERGAQARDVPPTPHHLPDALLLAQYRRLAEAGNLAAEARAIALERRLGLAE